MKKTEGATPTCSADRLAVVLENGAVVQAALEDVGARLGALNELASEGVHAEVTTYEVDTCVVQTYLVVADVLRIRERATQPDRLGTA